MARRNQTGGEAQQMLPVLESGKRTSQLATEGRSWDAYWLKNKTAQNHLYRSFWFCERAVK